MIFASVCSGIEAASCAWEPLGWQAAWFSEIDPFCRALLMQRYPHVPNYGDLRAWREWSSPEHERPSADIDVLIGGTPCQSFSIAGSRAGLDDERGDLTLEFFRLVGAYRPRWVVWENVPGVLSIDGGQVFGAVLGGLAERGYGFAYRILDAQFFGLAQRRARVFVVGCLGDWRRAAAVLFERASLSGDLAASAQARQDVAAPLSRGTDSNGGYRNDADTTENLVASALSASAGHHGHSSRRGDGADNLIVAPLTGNHYADHASRESLLVAGTLGASHGNVRGDEAWTNRLVPTLDASYGRLQGASGQDINNGCGHLIAFGGNNTSGPIEVAAALNAHGGTGRLDFDSETLLCFSARQDPDVWADRTGPLDTDGTSQAIAFSCKDYGADAGHVAPTLRAMGHTGSSPNGGGQVAVAFAENSRQELSESSVMGALKVGGGKPGQSYPAIRQATHVRRLTPLECERLQGFPDGWTAVQFRGKPAKDGPRYKAIGNSQAVPVIRWIGERIAAVDALT